MAFGFKVTDASGNVLIDSTETSTIQRDEIITSATSGSQTYTDCTGQEAYVIPVMKSNGSIAAGTWTTADYNISTSVDANNNPSISYNIQCINSFPFLGSLCSGLTYHLFVFTK